MVKPGVLNRKILRDIWNFRGPALATMAVITAGITAFFCFYSAFLNLDLTRRSYYRQYRFADLEVILEQAASQEVIQRLSSVTGIQRVETRIVEDVNLDLEGVKQPQTGRIISLPNVQRKIINDIYLTKGTYFSSDRMNEIIVNERFFAANNLTLGDMIHAVINNRKQPLKIVGTALSPEYVYAIPSASEFVPDDKGFAILWVKRDFAEMSFDMQGLCNNAIALVSNKRQLDVIAEKVETILEPYGVYSAITRDDQVSNYYLSSEIKSLKASAVVIACLFLGIAALILLIMMRRMVKYQRTQIGVLKAFGYSNSAILMHFWNFGLIVSVAGATLGVLAGYGLGRQLMALYKQFFQFPILEYRGYPTIYASSYLLSVGFALAGATMAVHEIVRLPPAEAIRPEAPVSAHTTPVEKFLFLWRRLSFTSKIIVRNMFRNRGRSILSVVGVMLASGIVLMGYFFFDSSNELMRYQFQEILRHDVQVTLATEHDHSVVYEARNFPYTLYVEPMLNYGFEIRSGWRKKNVVITGVPERLKLRRLLDAQGNKIEPPSSGLLLGEQVARSLRVKAGDSLYIEPLSGKITRTYEVKIAGIVKEYLGLSAYADVHFLSRLLQSESLVSSLLLRVEKGKERELTEWLKDLPAVSGSSIKQDTYEKYREMLLESMDIWNVFLLIFSGVIAFSIIYNSTTISVMERSRELATLRVMGFTVDEVGDIVFNENYLLSFVGLILGYPFGLLVCLWLIKAFETDLYRLPFYIHPRTYLLTAIYTLVFVTAANLITRRKLKRMDLIEVLKSRE